MKDYRILFQGDSITDGNRYKDEASRWDGNHQIGHSYAYMTAGMLSAQYPEKHLRFYNRGVSGNAVPDLYKRWEDASLLMHPDLLTILIGTNDVGRCFNMDDPTPYYADFDRLFRRILTLSREENPDIRIILLEPFRLYLSEKETYADWKRGWERLSCFQEQERIIAKDFDAVFVPLQSVFDRACTLREPEYWMWDGIHPTPAGHYLVAEKLNEAIRELF